VLIPPSNVTAANSVDFLRPDIGRPGDDPHVPQFWTQRKEPILVDSFQAQYL